MKLKYLSLVAVIFIFTIFLKPIIAADYNYFDNYSTDGVEWDSYNHSPIVDSLPWTFLYGLLCWDYASYNRVLGFYDGWEVEADAYLYYRFPITGSAPEDISGGTVSFDIISPSKLVRIGLEVSYNGSTWEYLGMVMSTGHYDYPLSPPAGCTRVWWKFEGTGSGLDNLSVSLDYGEVCVDEKQVSLPEKIQLSEPYPNPFNFSTRFDLTLAKDSNIKVSIWDIAGREVKAIKEGYFTSGEHTLAWCPMVNLEAGVYFLTLQNEFEKISRRLIYLK